MDEIARLYPTQVFLTLFGLPVADHDQFIQWSEAIIENATVGSGEPPPEVMENAMALFTYLQGYVERKRAEPGDDMLSRILNLSGDEAWSDKEVLGSASCSRWRASTRSRRRSALSCSTWPPSGHPRHAWVADPEP